MRITLLFALLAGVARAQNPLVSSRTLEAAHNGINLIYAMDFDAAEREFAKIREENPDQPFGYYGPAAASWVHFVYGSTRSDPALEADFNRRVDLAIDKAQRWVKRYPNDAYAYLTLGGAYGMRTRLSIVQRRWLRAVVDGRRALGATRLALKADPQFVDAYLGIGMWEYYADIFPRLVKSLGRLLLGGDRALGIKHIQIAAEKGQFINITAQLILIEISLEDQFGNRNPRRALEMIRGLRRRFPASSIFHQIEQVSLFESGDYDGAWESTDDYVRGIGSHRPFYQWEDMARMHVVYGTIHFVRRELPEAVREFDLAARMAGDKAKPNRWALWGMYREGEVEDALGRRDLSKKLYLGVVAYPDIFGFHSYAKTRMAHPYVAGSPVGPVSPP